MPLTTRLDESARALLEANTQTADLDGRRFRFTVPSVTAYPFQWFWDSCFHAIVWSRYDAERAADELRGLLAAQEPDGLIPHVVFWKGDLVSRLQWHHLESRTSGRIPFHRAPHTTAQMQPRDRTGGRARRRCGRGRLPARGPPPPRALLPVPRGAPRPRRDGLISIVSQFESGLDFSPIYDEEIGARDAGPAELLARTRLPQLRNKLANYDLDTIFRRYRHHQEDVLVNAVYGQGLRALARLAGRAGREAVARWATRTADGVTEALVDRAWDEELGLFVNLVGPDERRTSVKTIHGLMPLILPDLPGRPWRGWPRTSRIRRRSAPRFRSLGRSRRTDLHARPPAARLPFHLARAALTEHELVPRPRAARTRSRRDCRPDRGTLPRGRRAGRVQ